jgi:hypothetical protein
MIRILYIILLAMILHSIPLKIETQGDGIELVKTTAHASARPASTETDINQISYGQVDDRNPASGIKLNETATTVLEVVLNEMAGSAVVGRRGAAQDALYIASVIANRANATNKSQRAIVSVQQEFNGYGIPMRPGAKRDLLIAISAIEHVANNGPVHSGIFYATPSCVKNLPKGLMRVTRSAGHVFFIDPMYRSFKTVHGYKRPKKSFSSYPIALLKLDKAPTASGNAIPTALILQLEV